MQAPRERGGVQPLLRDLRQRLLEGVEVLFREGAAGRHRVAAEAQQHARVALGHEVERVAQVKAGDGAARALELVLAAGRLARREDEGRAVQPVLQPRGDDADHALVEVGVEHAQRGRRLLAGLEQRLGQLQRLLAHAALDLAALAVDGVEALRQFGAARRVVGQQAFDAERHVRQPAGRIDARPEREAEVEGGGRRGSRPAAANSAARPQRQRAGADAAQALRDQAPVVGVEPDHVGHRAQRHQVEQRVEAAAARPRRSTPRARSSARSASST